MTNIQFYSLELFIYLTVCLFTLPVSLIGKGAPPEMIQKLTYMALCHSAKIERIDTVRAYTFGTRYFVEVCSDNIVNNPLNSFRTNILLSPKFSSVARHH